MRLKEKRSDTILALSAIFAGIINVLVGAGGGVLIIFAMQFFMREINEKSVYAITNTAIMVLSLLSLFSYLDSGELQIAELAPFIVPALVGGLIGALLLGRIKTKHLRFIFAAITFYSGVRMVL